MPCEVDETMKANMDTTANGRGARTVHVNWLSTICRLYESLLTTNSEKSTLRLIKWLTSITVTKSGQPHAYVWPVASCKTTQHFFRWPGRAISKCHVT